MVSARQLTGSSSPAIAETGLATSIRANDASPTRACTQRHEPRNKCIENASFFLSERPQKICISVAMLRRTLAYLIELATAGPLVWPSPDIVMNEFRVGYVAIPGQK